MAKIGRNELCPCGSGKKYKKCCIDKDEQRNVMQPKPMERFDYSHLLSYEEVNEMSNDEIIKKLEKMGIPFDQEKFLNDIENSYSAEEISENWFREYSVMAEGREEDFPWFAAWILWERMAPPEYLSMEQMDDLIEEGIKYLEAKDYTSACDKWLTVWEAIKVRIKPVFQTLDYLDQQYSGSFFIREICQDLEMWLYKAGLEDSAYFEKRITFCREFCSFFPNESDLIIHNMRRAIGESYAYLNDYQSAESEFEKLVRDFPKNPWGYIGWGDIYFFGPIKDYNKARELYKEALSITSDQHDIEAIEERIEEMSE